MRKITIPVLLMSICLLCSCSNTKTNNENNEPKVTEFVLPSKVTAPSLTYENNDNYFHYVYEAYSLDGDIDVSYVSNEHKIVGTYENITFDMDIYTDEGNMPTVGVYEATIWNDKAFYLAGYNESNILLNYCFTGFAEEYASTELNLTNSIFDNEDQTIKNIFDSAELVDISSMEAFDGLRNLSVSSNDQELYPTAIHYVIDADDILSVTTDSRLIDFYTVRTAFNGLPISFSYPTMASKMISWDANEVVGSPRDYEYSYYSTLNEICFSYIDNKIDVTNVIEEGLTVIPIEDCIMSTISQIQHDTRNLSDSSITVLSAELTYCSALELDWNSHLKNPTYGIKFDGNGNKVCYWLIPTWSVYYAVESEDGYRYIGTVYINPVTGEGMEIDISELIISDDYGYPSNVNRFDVIDMGIN